MIHCSRNGCTAFLLEQVIPGKAARRRESGETFSLSDRLVPRIGLSSRDVQSPASLPPVMGTRDDAGRRRPVGGSSPRSCQPSANQPSSFPSSPKARSKRGSIELPVFSVESLSLHFGYWIAGCLARDSTLFTSTRREVGSIGGRGKSRLHGVSTGRDK